MAVFSPTVEVCREFLDKKCKRDERYCKFAHPTQRLDISSGRVVCCVDFLKNRCNRTEPPCRYYHPPKHIQDRVLGEMKYQRLCREFGIQDEEGNLDLQAAVMNTLLPQLNVLTDKIMKYGMTEGYDNLDPSVADTLKSCQNLLDSMVHSPSDPQQRNDVIEVCREFLRGDCNRADTRCKFAHPSPEVYVNADQTVTVCLKYLRGSCSVTNCHYFHIPNHLKKYIRGEFPGKRKRKLSLNGIEEGPSSKSNTFPFGRTPPRVELVNASGLHASASEWGLQDPMIGSSNAQPPSTSNTDIQSEAAI